MAQHIEAVHQAPFTLGGEQASIEALRQDVKEHRQSLIQRLTSFNMMYPKMVKECHFLLTEDKTEWNIKLLETQPTQVLSNMFTLISNIEEIYLEDPRLLK